MKRNVGFAALMMVFAVVLGACSKKQPPVAPQPEPLPSQQARPTQPTNGGTTGRTDDAARDAEMRRLTAILEQMVFFDYDDSTIRTDAQEMLAAKVPFLRANPGIRLRIDGHADERGSVEYNLALGMRRANAVRDYLTGFGVEAGRFDTNSMGEDHPLVNGSNEAAWSQNRRAEFRVSGAPGR
jgi:peptidoglycan-associated lipoprotein